MRFTPMHSASTPGRAQRWWWPTFWLACAAWVFLKVADEVAEGEAHAIDLWILQACRLAGQPGQPTGPVWFQEAMRDLTALGSPVVLTLVVLAAWGHLMLSRQRGLAWLTLGATLSGQAMALGLKAWFARARPDEAFHATVAAGHSFPSSHAMMSAVVCLSLAALLSRAALRRRQRGFILGVAALITGMVGLSRIYLGVHWASDVVGGWALGVAWALAGWMVARALNLGRDNAA